MIASSAAAAMVQVIGWCLVHFVWQAAIVAGLYAVVRALVPRGNPRYLAALAALVVLAVLPVVTGWHEYHAWVAAPAWINAPAVGAASVPRAAGGGVISGGWQTLLDPALPWLVLAWASVVLVLATRVARQWLRLRAIVAAAAALPEWQVRAREFGARMGLKRLAPVLASVRIATPTLVGWLRPAVVLPLSILSRMPPAQIDLVLAHELAHLKRLDHLANLFQVVLETLFFYHPAVRWISREARDEREVCCDALALAATGGSRRDFIEAIANLAELNAGGFALVVAADGGVLVERARFIAGAGPGALRRPAIGGRWVGLVAVLLVAAGTGWWWHAALQARIVSTVAAATEAAVTRELVAGAAGTPVLPLPAPMPRPLLAPLAPVAATAPTRTAAAIAIPRVHTAAAVALAIAPLPLPDRPLMAVADPLPTPSVAVAPPPAPPIPVREVPPAYPPQAMLQGLQGEVIVEFSLTADGVPQDLRVVHSGAGALDEAALLALSQWRFAPAPGAGARRYRQSFAFRLGAQPDSRACLVLTGTHICRHVSGAPATARGALRSRP